MDHTPGPWFAQHLHVKACGCGDLKRDGFDDHNIVEAADGRTKDEAIANARLIAATPELLEACKPLEAAARSVADITHAAGIGLDDPILSERLSELWQSANKARAAIAKAEHA